MTISSHDDLYQADDYRRSGLSAGGCDWRVGEWFDSAVKCIPLARNGDPVTKIYCVFWKENNSGNYIEEFAQMLKEPFG